MNILLWVLQVALAFLCIPGGVFKIIKIEDLKKNVASMRALPRGLWAVVGVFECVAGICLLIPALTPIAAAAVAIESVIITAIYIYYRDFSPMVFTVAMALIAAFIAYGRFELAPF